MQLVPRQVVAPWVYHYLGLAPQDVPAAMACAARWDVAKVTPPDENNVVHADIQPAPPNRQGSLAVWIANEIAKGNGIYVDIANHDAWCTGGAPSGKVRSLRRLDDIDLPERTDAFVLAEPSTGWITPGMSAGASLMPAAGAPVDWQKYALPAGVALGVMALAFLWV